MAGAILSDKVQKVLDDGLFLELEGEKPQFLGKYFKDELNDERWQPAEQAITDLIDRWRAGKASSNARASNENFHKSTSPGVQGERTTCTSFALLAAMEGMLRRAGIDTDLSEQHAYYLMMCEEKKPPCTDMGIGLSRAAGILTANKVALEAVWHYYPNKTTVKANCTPPAGIAQQAHYRIGHSFPVPGPNSEHKDHAIDVEALRILIDNGFDAALSLINALGVRRPYQLDGISLQYATPEDVVNALALPNRVDLFGHAVLVIGHDTLSDGTRYFVCKNSRPVPGVTNAKGFVLMSENYVKAYARYGLVVTSVEADGVFHELSARLPQGSTVRIELESVLRSR